jgi:AcrR family transcriptional regulator
MGLRERKKERTRHEIIRAAVDLFQEQGYDTTTIDGIVAKANYSRSTFFRHFGTKEDVLFGGLGERMARLVEDLRELPSNVNPWRAAREAISQDALNHANDAPELAKECVALWFSEPALQRRYAEMALASEDLLAQYFAEKWGVDPDNSLECRIIASAMIGVARATIRATFFDSRDMAHLLDRGFDLLEQDLVNFSPGRSAAPVPGARGRRAG